MGHYRKFPPPSPRSGFVSQNTWERDGSEGLTICEDLVGGLSNVFWNNILYYTFMDVKFLLT